MTGAYADVSALEQEIIAESLRRVASVRSAVAIVLAQILEVDEHELDRFADSLTSAEADFVLRLIEEVIQENGGQA